MDQTRFELCCHLAQMLFDAKDEMTDINHVRVRLSYAIGF